MPIENFSEIPEYFEANKESEEVKKLIGTFNPVTSLTDETVDGFVESNPLLKSARDKFNTKGIESYKTNTMPEKIKEALDKFKAENYPDETEEQKAMKEMKNDLLTEKSARLKAEVLNKAMKVATDKKIPADLVDLVLSNDLETTLKNIDILETVINKERETAIQVFTKTNGRNPEKGTPEKLGDLESRYEKAKQDKNVLEIAKLNRLIHERKNKQ